jgi:predicted DNA-binding transcriptional regulator YafY
MMVIEQQPALSAAFTPGQTLRFIYRNWQGELAIRTVRVIRLSYGSTEWHREPQWLLEALDVEKGAVRMFAVRDMTPVPER